MSEVTLLDMQLDIEQRKLDESFHNDPLRVVWFGVPDDDE